MSPRRSQSGIRVLGRRLGSSSGHLLIFRELHNGEPGKSIRLKFLAGRTITLVDLRRGATSELRVSDDGCADFHIEQGDLIDRMFLV